MKKILLSVTIVCTLVFCLPTFAQNSTQSLGFMGKRFALKYSIGMSFSGRNPSIIDLERQFANDKVFIKIPVSHTADIEYVIKERKSLLFGYTYTGFKRKLKSESIVASSINGLSSNNKINSIGFTYRLYSKSRSAFAPYGNYFGYRIGYLFGSAAQNVYVPNTSPSNSSFRLESFSYRSVFVGFEFGRQFVLFERLLLDLNVRCNLPFQLFRDVLRSNYGDPMKNIAKDVMISESFQLKIAIGGLIF